MPTSSQCKTAFAYWHLQLLERNFMSLIAYPRNTIHSSGICGPEVQVLTSGVIVIRGGQEHADWPWHKLAHYSVSTDAGGSRRPCGQHRQGGELEERSPGRRLRNMDRMVEQQGLRCWRLSSQVPQEPPSGHVSTATTVLAGEGLLDWEHIWRQVMRKLFSEIEEGFFSQFTRTGGEYLLGSDSSGPNPLPAKKRFTKLHSSQQGEEGSTFIYRDFLLFYPKCTGRKLNL